MSIILTNIIKYFNDNLILNNVSLEVFDNELFVLLGSSGSGKSTLLRIISGLAQPESGRVEINGQDVTFLTPQSRNTGFVFQNYSVFRHMTVKDNIEFGLKIRKVSPDQRKKQSAELLDLVGLTGLESRYADQLSGGQQQRVALARALSYSPSVLLLDEPFGALDVKIRAQLRKSLKEIQREVKVTTILVTHDQEEAFELSDRIGIINHGQLIETGEPENLYYSPGNEFTAGFLGGGNVLVGRKHRESVQLGSAIIPFPKNAPPHDENAPVSILFRPESVVISEPGRQKDNEIHLGTGRIKAVRFSGSIKRIIVEIENLKGVEPILPELFYGQNLIQIEAVTTDIDPRQVVSPGSEVSISLKKFHILNPTGLKILIYIDSDLTDLPHIEYAFKLTELTGGNATLFRVLDSPEENSLAMGKLESIRMKKQEILNMTSSVVRNGNYSEEIIKQVQQGLYEIAIFNFREKDKKLSRSWKILNGLNVPILLVKNKITHINNILICTAGGEPGKEDITFGGRFAKLTGSKVTLFHVLNNNTPEAEKKRKRIHLESGRNTLETLNVRSEIKIASGNPFDIIIKETESSDYNLLIIGAPAPKIPSSLFWPDLTYRISMFSKIPVLIVPMTNR